MRRLLTLALCGLLIAGQAEAARKTPSTRFTGLAITSGAKTASASIPAGSTWAIIGCVWGSTSSNNAPASVTLDSQAATKIASAETAMGNVAAAIYKVSGFTTGAGKTFAWTNTNAQNALDCGIEYRDGTPTYGASDSDFGGSGTLTSIALANSVGDEIISFYGSDGASISSVGSGQTQLDDTVGTYFYYGFTTETGTGTSDVQAFTSTGAKAFASVVVSTAVSAPTFSAGPTYATVSNTQISATFTADAASETYFCALYAPGAAAPTAAQVAAGTNAHSAVVTGTTTGASEAHNLTSNDSPAFPKYDPYCVLNNGSYSAVPATTTTATNPPTGYQYITLASVTATGSEPKAYNDADLITLNYDTQTANFTVGSVVVDSTSGAWGYIRGDSDSGASGTLTIDKRSGTFADNDSLYDQGGAVALVNGAEAAYTAIAINDMLSVPTTVSPSSASLAVDTSGQYVYTASGRQSALTGRVFDVSAGAYLSLNLDAWFNNTAPHCSTAKTAVFKHGTAIDFDLASLCGDDDNDTLSYARLSTLPTGATLNPTTGHVTGTVTADGDYVVSFVVYDQAGDYTTQSVTFTVKTVWTVPDCAGLTTNVCSNQIIATTLGRVSLHYVYQCSAVIASCSVISQSPAAGGDVSPGDTETITTSVGNVCSVKSPDCTSTATTLLACQDLYTAAFSDLVTFSTTARCDNTVAANDVIATFPHGNVEIPASSKVSMVYSLGACSATTHPMVNCIAQTTAECLTLLANRFGTAVTMVANQVPCSTSYTSGEIFAQTPRGGKKIKTPAVLTVRYCQ